MPISGMLSLLTRETLSLNVFRRANVFAVAAP